jgi:CheY-like chemotaxis protein
MLLRLSSCGQRETPANFFKHDAKLRGEPCLESSELYQFFSALTRSRLHEPMKTGTAFEGRKAMQPILVADDNADDIFLFQHAAKSVRLKVPLKFVSDGEEVVQYLLGAGVFADRTNFPLPRLLFLDNKMTFRSGLETVRWLRQEAPPSLRNLTALLLSSSLEESDVRAAYELGVNGYLVKPTDYTTLGEMISCAYAFWCHHNQAPAVSVLQKCQPWQVSLQWLRKSCAT